MATYALNWKQKAVIWICTAAAIVAGLYPPWGKATRSGNLSAMGYSPIWKPAERIDTYVVPYEPPSTEQSASGTWTETKQSDTTADKIDLERLLIEWFLIGITTAAGIATLKSEQK